MDFLFLENPDMDIKQTIASNLNAWMANSTAFRVSKDVATRSGVGASTVQRIRRAEINVTVENLAAIAAVFGKTAQDLLATTTNDRAVSLSDNGNPVSHAAQSVAQYVVSRWPLPYVDQHAYESLTDEGKVWVQARTTAAIEEATRQFGTQSSKRTA